MFKMKIKTRPSKKSKVLKCPRCHSTNIRKRGLIPTNPQKASKGFHGPHHAKYHQECVDRLFSKRYVCQNCKKGFNYGNAGRPLKR